MFERKKVCWGQHLKFAPADVTKVFPVQHVSLILGRLQMKWLTVSNWLFPLIWDQSLPYELWFWLKGKFRGMATSFPKFTTRFKRL